MMNDDSKDNMKPDEQNTQRRKLITSIAAISGVSAASKWNKPIIDSVILPAHAQSSSILTGSFSGAGNMTTP